MFNTIASRLPIKHIIASQIEDAILTKKYIAGDKLPSENELCTQFNVSRTSVREALQILSAHGFITVEKGRGIFVNKITSESVIDPLQKYLKFRLEKDYVLDLVHARQMIEPAIAREAAINHSEEDIILLDQDITLLSESSGGYKELAELDMIFHQDLAKSTKNYVVPLLLKPIHNLLPELKSTIYATVNEAKESAVEWHRNIFKAIKKRNADEAFNYMTEHLIIAEKHAVMVINTANRKDENKEISNKQ